MKHGIGLSAVRHMVEKATPSMLSAGFRYRLRNSALSIRSSIGVCTMETFSMTTIGTFLCDVRRGSSWVEYGYIREYAAMALLAPWALSENSVERELRILFFRKTHRRQSLHGLLVVIET